MRANNSTETRSSQLQRLPREVLRKLKIEIDRLGRSNRPCVLRFVQTMRARHADLR
jgi:hypothetical protein